MKAIVIGAGIGGLSAAVALKQSGIDCDVYEAVKEIKPVKKTRQRKSGYIFAGYKLYCCYCLF